MKAHLITALITATALFTQPALAAEPKTSKPAAAKPSLAPDYAKNAPVLKLNGSIIKYTEVQEIWKNLFSGETPPKFSTFDEKIRQNVLRGMISERLVYEHALKAGVDKKKEVKDRVATIQKQVVMQHFIEEKAQKLVSEKDIKALYNKKAHAAKGNVELKARHILVSTEEDAKKILAELKKGGDFKKMAKAKSSDKGSGASGGDLGWFGKDRMVKEFADAAFKLKKGEVSAPVKTAFGWHVIKLEDTRPVKFAAYNEMKEGLRTELSNQKIQGYIESLLGKADIAYYGPDGKEKPFSKTLAPASGKAKK